MAERTVIFVSPRTLFECVLACGKWGLLDLAADTRAERYVHNLSFVWKCVVVDGNRRMTVMQVEISPRDYDYQREDHSEKEDKKPVKP